MAEHLISFADAPQNLLSGATFLAENIKSAEGHAQAMQTIIPFYLAKDDVDLAAALADTVADPFVRDKLLTLVAEKCAAIDDDEYAFQLIDAIEDFAVQEAARERIALQKSVKGNFETALEIADKLPHPDFAYAGIVTHQTEQKASDEAVTQTLEKIEFQSAKASALHAMAALYLQQGNNALSASTLDRALSEAETIEHEEERIRFFIEIANLYLEVNRSDRAIEAFDKAKTQAEKLDNVHRDFFLANIALGFLRAGSLDLADRTLDLVADKTQTASCLTGFSQEFWKKEERDEALETLEEAYAILKSQREREIRDSRARFGLFGSIAVQFAQYEKPERALEIAQSIADEERRYKALAQAAQTLVLQGKDDWARQALRAIEEDGQRLLALVGMSDALFQQNKKEEAVKLLDEAFQLAETVPQYTMRSGVYNALAERYARYEKNEKVREAARESLQTVSLIRDQSNMVVALANLAEIFEQNNFSLNETEKQILETLIHRSEFQ